MQVVIYEDSMHAKDPHGILKKIFEIIFKQRWKIYKGKCKKNRTSK